MSASEKTNAVRERFEVLIYGASGEQFVLNLSDIDEQFNRITVRQLKEKIRSDAGYEEKGDFRLIFLGRILYDEERTLSEYGIQHMFVIRMMMILRGGGSPPPDRMGEKDGRNRSQERLDDFLGEQSSFQRDTS